MKLGIVTTAFFTKEMPLGISNTVQLISRHLIRRDVDISIFATQSAGSAEREKFNGIDVKRFGFSKIISGIDYNISPGMVGCINKKGLDIIHSFHYAYFPATAGFIASRMKSIPHIFTTSYHPQQLTRLKRSMMRLYDITQGQFILRGSFMSLPQNMNELNSLRKIAKFDHEIVPCPINEKIFYPREGKSSKLTVLFVGAMVPWKGAETAFEICREIEKEHKNIRFVFIGDGILRKNMIKRASKKFIFLKNIPTRELGLWFSRADVFLYPTKFESFGRVVAEALCCGTPVVSTRVGAIPETLGPGGYTVDYGDWKKMKEFTVRLLTDSRLRKKISKKSLRYARQYKSENVAYKIYKIYKSALDK